MHDLKIALVGLVVGAVPLVLMLARAWVSAKVAKLQAEEWRAKHHQRVTEPAVDPGEINAAIARAEAEVDEGVRQKTKRQPKAPLALLLALVGLSGCASTSDADLRQLADQQRLERTVERQAEDLAELQAALASHAQALQQHQQALAQVRQVASQAGLQGALAPLQKMAERFELVGARLDHAEDGLERAGWKRAPELAAQVAEIKAAAEAEQGGGK